MSEMKFGNIVYKHERDPVLVFCSSNENKFEEIKNTVTYHNHKHGTKYNVLLLNLEVDEIQSMDTSDVAVKKIRDIQKIIEERKNEYYVMKGGVKNFIFRSNDYIIFCEDTGLGFSKMKGFPGALIKYYYDSIKENHNGDLHLTNAEIVEKHGGDIATFSTSFGIYDAFFKKFSHVTHEVKCKVSEKYDSYGNGFDFDYILEPLIGIEFTIAHMNAVSKLAPKPRSEIMKNQFLKMMHLSISKSSLSFDSEIIASSDSKDI